MKIFKPTTPSRRGMKGTDFSILTKKKPEKKLLIPIKKTGGRNNLGRITIRHRGGGAKRMYRMIDFGQKKKDILGEVIAIEYDPNRSCFIILILYEDGQKGYLIAPQKIKKGDKIITAEKTDYTIGNRMQLKNIISGTDVYNIELEFGKGGKIVRSAGCSAKVLSQADKYTIIKMPSSETRKISSKCYASIGVVSNPEHRFENLGKAGRKRWRGRRPHVRGSAMNAVDHPHGGGEGRAGIGMPYPKTPWGKPTKGVKTRNKKRWTKKLIIKRRK